MSQSKMRAMVLDLTDTAPSVPCAGCGEAVPVSANEDPTCADCSTQACGCITVDEEAGFCYVCTADICDKCCAKPDEEGPEQDVSLCRECSRRTDSYGTLSCGCFGKVDGDPYEESSLCGFTCGACDLDFCGFCLDIPEDLDEPLCPDCEKKAPRCGSCDTKQKDYECGLCSIRFCDNCDWTPEDLEFPTCAACHDAPCANCAKLDTAGRHKCPRCATKLCEECPGCFGCRLKQRELAASSPTPEAGTTAACGCARAVVVTSDEAKSRAPHETDNVCFECFDCKKPFCSNCDRPPFDSMDQTGVLCSACDIKRLQAMIPTESEGEEDDQKAKTKPKRTRPRHKRKSPEPAQAKPATSTAVASAAAAVKRRKTGSPTPEERLHAGIDALCQKEGITRAQLSTFLAGDTTA